MAVVTTGKKGRVAVIVSDHPPVNALSSSVRQGLADGLDEALSDDSVDAIVIRCDGRTFFAGADITEFGKAASGPSLGDIIDRLESASKPVVAAIHGTAFGGGLEIALACHYRVAVPSAKLGLPEVKLGLIPGAGGTQRLPRVVGVEAALPLIVTGDPIPAGKAHEIGLVDAVVSENALEGDAVAFASDRAAKSTHPVASQRTDRLPAPGEAGPVFDAFRKKNDRKISGLEAPLAAIQAVKAAVEQPFEEGIAKERELFGKLITSDQSKAMRHVFFAERAAARIDDIPADTPVLPVKSVGIIGAGTMGGGIAMNFLSAGIPVTIVEREQGPLDRGVGIMQANYDRSAKRGRLSEQQVSDAMGKLTATLDFNALADCDLVIEAVFENMDIKKDIFARLDDIMKDGAILASNTSALNLDEIASATKRPEAVIGLHFFSPANVMRLLEVVRGEKTSPAVLKTSMSLAKKIGKIAVVSGVCPGFIGNRMLRYRQMQAQKLIMEGAKPWDVDRVLTEFGFRMGPFQMSDLAGLDIGWNKETSKGETLRDVLCERDRRGQKTGKGYYDYDENRRPTPSPEVEALIAEFIKKSGREQREIDDTEILERLLYPMVNEGAKILEEGIAQRASDIDVVWLNGYGWPIQTGGPMFWADQVGLDRIVERLEAHQDRLGKEVTLSALLKQKASKGERFNG